MQRRLSVIQCRQYAPIAWSMDAHVHYSKPVIRSTSMDSIRFKWSHETKLKSWSCRRRGWRIVSFCCFARTSWQRSRWPIQRTWGEKKQRVDCCHKLRKSPLAAEQASDLWTEWQMGLLTKRSGILHGPICKQSAAWGPRDSVVLNHRQIGILMHDMPQDLYKLMIKLVTTCRTSFMARHSIDRRFLLNISDVLIDLCMKRWWLFRCSWLVRLIFLIKTAVAICSLSVDLLNMTH